MIFRIDDGTGPRIVGADEFPIAVALSRHGGLVFGEAAEGSPALWLRSHGGRISVQPESRTGGMFRRATRVRHNETAIRDSVWIEAGDRVGIGDVTIDVSAGTDGLILSTGRPTAPSTAAAEAPVMPPRPRDTEPAKVDSDRRAAPAPARAGHRRARHFAYAALLALALGAGYVVAASPVRIAIDPEPDSISVTGRVPPIYVLGRYLALPGNYRIVAMKAGYHRLEEALTVAFGSAPDLRLAMRKMPGFLKVRSRPVDGAQVSIDGTVAGRTPLEPVTLEPGRHELRLTADRHKPATVAVDINGAGETQTVEVTLRQGWGTLLVASVPEAATVTLNGRVVGVTPYRAEPMEGSYRLGLSLETWKAVTRDIVVTAGERTRLPLIRLERADGIVDLTTVPEGALVSLNGDFRGRSPIRILVAANTDHRLRLTKPGYAGASRVVSVGPGRSRSVRVLLRPEYGTVFIVARPADAELKIDGRRMGRASRRLRLTAVPHEIEISRPGYQSYTTTVTPRSGVSSRLNVRLETLESLERAKLTKSAETSTGQKLMPVWIDKPIRFTVGASRREAGRRSNESRYRVELTRSFLIGTHEVSNEDFRRFRPNHNSGAAQGIDLNAPNQPVASVSWDDAARYANWLSAREGLPPVYREDNGKMVAVVPMTTGYRLPTEAEWVYVARYEAGRRRSKKPLKFPWGDTMPPTRTIGNFADEAAAVQVALTLPGYADGFVAAAPVGKFPANKAGLHDLGGNVSEWCHDFYDINTAGTKTALRDPSGPAHGVHHVVRGSSWRHGGLSQLRLAYRDFGDKPRNDLGFRIARYAK